MLLGLSLAAAYDMSAQRVYDARLHVFAAGTDTPAPAYEDASFGSRHEHPVALRSNWTWPVIFLPPGSYRLRVTDPFGFVYDQIEDLTIDAPSTATGSGSAVDPTTLAQTGDIRDRYGTGTIPGWVRLNGRTLGSSTSSASERVNDDCHALFVLLWNQDPNLAVSGGRGANAESDWAAAKTIALPDARGRLLATLDDLGNTAAGQLNGGLFTFGSATALGSYGGESSHAQSIAEMPNHSFAVTATMDAQGSHYHTGTTDTFGGGGLSVPYNQVVFPFPKSDFSAPVVTSIGGSNPSAYGPTTSGLAHAHTFQTSTDGLHAHNITVSVTSAGSGAAMSWLPPFLLVSTYIKL